MIQKGDIVSFNRFVRGHHTPDYRNRIIIPFSGEKIIKGIVIGFSFLRSGQLREEDNYLYLHLPKDTKVWLVEPLESDSNYVPKNRYVKPYRVLESDLRKD